MTDWNYQLLRAAEAGDLTLLKEAIANGADVNYRNIDGYTALMWAARYRYTQIARELIANGANLDLRDDTSNTALMWAASMGKTQIASELIAKGANLDLQDRWGDTALSNAREHGHQEIAKLIEEAMAAKAAPAPKTALQKELERRAALADKRNHWGLA